MARNRVVGPDAFTGTDDVAIETYSANWTKVVGSAGNMCIRGNKLGAPYGVNELNIAVWSGAGTFAAGSQYAGAVVSALTGSSRRAGVGCRFVTGSGGTGYYFYLQDNNGTGNTNVYKIIKRVAGSETNLRDDTNTTGTVTNGDALWLEWEDIGGGSITLKAYINSTQQGATITDSSSPLTSGKPAIVNNTDSTNMRLDDWEGGDMAGGGALVVSNLIQL